ncbi:hypothetical protein ACSBR1_019044 [Camellia fascicularis]
MLIVSSKKGVLNKFLFDIEDENQWKLEWAEMLDNYDAHDNHWLKLTFAVKEKWGWVLYEKRYKELEAGKHARKVKIERDSSLGCNCTKFEREGILCSHSLKVIRDILKKKEVLSQYIVKRWTKQAKVETVKDIKGNDIQVDVKFQQASRCFGNLDAISANFEVGFSQGFAN